MIVRYVTCLVRILGYRRTGWMGMVGWAVVDFDFDFDGER
jgi:hypothetical protein